ncbi:AAA family ATPase [Yinghuangia soli]|uniref:AAA family ATPase n=1 Tax=Yinghuangia soli TaxID=2908204 RepID=A0AA41Q2F9_9ACTN|nr:AAA family ATPase [Yinghuangia soli]MCF2529715.1 AAA family ATPase [Yinghuangia soli]
MDGKADDVTAAKNSTGDGSGGAGSTGSAGSAGGAAKRGGGDALAAARAALAALDKANSANSENAANRSEVAAAWQALNTLGDQRRPDGPATGSDWALPVVDAPETPYAAFAEAAYPDAAQPAGGPATPGAGGGNPAGSEGWAAPLIDSSAPDGSLQRTGSAPPRSSASPRPTAAVRPVARPDAAGTGAAFDATAAPEPGQMPANEDGDGPGSAAPRSPAGQVGHARRTDMPAPYAGAGGGAAAVRRGSSGSASDWAAPVLDAPPAPALPEQSVSDGRDRSGGFAVGAGSGPTGRAGADMASAPRVPRGRSMEPSAIAAEDAAEPDAEAVADVEQALAAGGAPTRLAAQALASLGPDAAALLSEDPWNLLALPGISPEQADLFGQTLQGRAADPDTPLRTQAILLWHLARAASEGHTAVDAASAVSVLEHFGVADALGAIRTAYENGRVMAFAERPAASEDADGAGDDDFDDFAEYDDADGADFDEFSDFADPFAGLPDRPVALALERHALAEESIADAVLRLMSTAEPSDVLASAGRGSTKALADALEEAGLVLYTPAAGEDSPQAPLALAAHAHAAGVPVVLAAPTADGRARLAAATRRTGTEDTSGPDSADSADSPEASLAPVTVRGLILGSEGPGRTPEGLLDLGLLVVAEAHLLDVSTAASLLEAVPDGARVILCGDPAELEPAGPGRVFGDLADSGAVPHPAAGEPVPGVLGALAHAVRGGSLPPVDAPDREVVLVGVRSAAEAVHRCVQLVADSIPRALGIPVDDTLVLTPAGGGNAGTTVLNAALKERLNPGPGQYGGFDIGDRVVHIPGQRAAAPGFAEARVVAAVPDGLAIVYRDAPDQQVVIPRARLGELRHGWAVTVHQALGVRRPGVVAMLPGDAGALVTRALVYTAFTRAQRHLSVVYPAGGSLPQAVAQAVGRSRTTRLADALREASADL